jgi:hypothetical protein
MLIPLILNNHGSDNERWPYHYFFEKRRKKVEKDGNFEIIN